MGYPGKRLWGTGTNKSLYARVTLFHELHTAPMRTSTRTNRSRDFPLNFIGDKLKNYLITSLL